MCDPRSRTVRAALARRQARDGRRRRRDQQLRQFAGNPRYGRQSCHYRRRDHPSAFDHADVCERFLVARRVYGKRKLRIGFFRARTPIRGALFFMRSRFSARGKCGFLRRFLPFFGASTRYCGRFAGESVGVVVSGRADFQYAGQRARAFRNRG